MSRPVTVSEAQERLLETAFDLYRIIQRLHHQHEGLKAEYEAVRKYYEAVEPPPDDGPPPIELAVAEEADMAADQLENVAEELLKSARLTETSVREKWRRQKARAF